MLCLRKKLSETEDKKKKAGERMTCDYYAIRLMPPECEASREWSMQCMCFAKLGLATELKSSRDRLCRQWCFLLGMLMSMYALNTVNRVRKFVSHVGNSMRNSA